MRNDTLVMCCIVSGSEYAVTRQGDSDSTQCESVVYWGLFYLEAMEVDHVMRVEIDCQGARMTHRIPAVRDPLRKGFLFSTDTFPER